MNENDIEIGVDYCVAHESTRNEDEHYCGAREFVDPVICSDCGGAGAVFLNEQDEVDCPKCEGDGSYATECELVPLQLPKPRPLVVEVYGSASRQFIRGAWTSVPTYRWRVRHTTNNETMASGEGYADPRDRDHAVHVLFPGVTVVEVGE